MSITWVDSRFCCNIVDELGSRYFSRALRVAADTEMLSINRLKTERQFIHRRFGLLDTLSIWTLISIVKGDQQVTLTLNALACKGRKTCGSWHVHRGVFKSGARNQHMADFGFLTDGNGTRELPWIPH